MVALVCSLPLLSHVLLAEDVAPVRLGSWPVNPFGQVGQVALHGDFAYCLNSEKNLLVVDVSKPEQPVLVGSRPVSPTSFEVRTDGRDVYLSSREGWSILNVQQPGQPRPSNAASDSTVLGICLDGGRAYVNSRSSISIMELGDWISALPPAVRPLGVFAGQESFRRIAVHGHLLCASTFEGSVLIYDVSNPTGVKELGRISLDAYELVLDGRFLFLAGRDGISVYDLAQPAKPVRVGQYQVENPSGLLLSGNRLYLTQALGYLVWSLDVLDVRIPQYPQLLGQYSTTVPIESFDVSGTMACLASGSGLTLLDLVDPTKPVVKNPRPAALSRDNKITVAGRYVFTTGWEGMEENRVGYFRAFDFADPKKPALISQTALANPGLAVTVSGNRAYVGEQDRVEVFDINDPAKPKAVGTPFPAAASDISVVGGHVFLSSLSGLRILQWERDALKELSRWTGSLQGSHIQTVVVGRRAFVLGDFGLSILDLDDPSRPRLVGSLPLPPTSQCMVVRGDRVYVGAFGRLILSGRFPSTVSVVDVSDPAAPRMIWSISEGESEIYQKLELLGGDLLVNGGLLVKTDFVGNHSDGSGNRSKVGFYQTGQYLSRDAGSFEDFAVAGDYVAGVDQYGGIEVVDFRRRANPQRLGTWMSPYPLRTAAFASGLAWFAVREASWLGANSGSLGVADISQPNQPRLLAFHPSFSGATELALDGDTLYMTGPTFGLKSLDVSDALHPSLVLDGPSFAGEIGGLESTEGRVYLAFNEYLAIFEPIERHSLRHLSAYKSHSITTGPIRFAVAGTNAFLLRGADLEVVNVSNPLQPRFVGLTAGGHSGIGIRAQGGRAYVTRSHPPKAPGGLRDTLLEIWNVTVPSRPVMESELVVTGSSDDLLVSGRFAHLVGDAGLVVVDILDSLHPRVVGGNRLAGGGRIVASSENFLIAGDRLIPTLGGGLEDASGLILMEPFQVNPLLRRPSFGANGRKFEVQGGLPGRVGLQKSPDLRQWLDWRIVELGSEVTEIEDPMIDGPTSFYRAMAP